MAQALTTDPVAIDWSQSYETLRTFCSPKGGAKPATFGEDLRVTIPGGVSAIVTQFRRCGDFYVYMSGPKGGWSAIGIDVVTAFERCAEQVPA